MKAIMTSIRPEWVVKILNGDLSILVRKRFPKDYIGWVYVYCTKRKPYYFISEGCVYKTRYDFTDNLNGKVVGRFWCDNVEEINKIIMYNRPFDLFETKTLQPSELLKQSCLRAKEMTKYFMFSNLSKESAAIHITKVEPFDKPMELKEFKSCLLGYNNCVPHNCQECPATKSLTRAPQSWCYIEI